jgi:hypothetical protein
MDSITTVAFRHDCSRAGRGRLEVVSGKPTLLRGIATVADVPRRAADAQTLDMTCHASHYVATEEATSGSGAVFATPVLGSLRPSDGVSVAEPPGIGSAFAHSARHPWYFARENRLRGERPSVSGERAVRMGSLKGTWPGLRPRQVPGSTLR